ncbi:hypothetical protein V6N11_082482 [Hibiscus sabdariffa]
MQLVGQKLGEARDRGHGMLHAFTEKSLVEKGQEWGHYKMFVLFQRAALRIANEESSRRGWMNLNGKKQRESSLPDNPKCSGMLTLSIQANSLKRFPPKFFADMPGLQVLCVGQTGIVAFPPSISKLKKLLPIQLPLVSAASLEDGGSRNPCFTSYRDLLFAGKDWRIESFNFFVGEQGNIPASDFNVFKCSAEKHLKFSRGGAKFSDAVSVALKRATSFKLIGHTTARSLTDHLLPDASEVNLEAFTVEECQEMKSIANATVSPASASGQPLVFECLKELHIRKLPKLESIWQGEIASESFSALTTLKLKECRVITRLFPLNMVSQLPQLQNLHVDNCERIENIIQAENSDDEVAFASLKEFQLSNLPRLSSICDARLNLPSLEKSGSEHVKS